MNNSEKSKVKELIKTLLVTNGEILQTIELLERQQTFRAGALLGSRMADNHNLFSDLTKNKDFDKLFKDCIKELNTEKKSRDKAQEKANNEFNKKFSESIGKVSYVG